MSDPALLFHCKHMMGLGQSVKWKEGMSSGSLRIFQEMGGRGNASKVIYFCADSKLKYSLKTVSKSEHYIN